MTDMLFRPAHELVTDMAEGKLSAVELMSASLDRIEAMNPDLTAVVAQRDRDDLLAEAAAADQVPVEKRGALHGIPMAVKDLTNVRGLPTSMGSLAVPLTPAPQDALLVSRMRAAGAIFTGKTNVPEMGLGSHSYNDVYGTTLNPYDHTVSAGGSSGGAGVALATGMQTIADGSDMMGSLRNPAAWNNVYGFRPSFGVVPREPKGDVFLHKLSTPGPMARNVRDIALLLSVQAGGVPGIPHTLPKPDLSNFAASDLRGKKIGWLADWGGALAFEAGILDLAETALKQLENAGAEVTLLPAPFSRDALWDSWVGLRGFANAADDGHLLDDPKSAELIKPAVRYEIEVGRSLSAMDVQRLSEIRSDWFRKTHELFDQFDALILPTTQVFPFAQNIDYPTEINGVAMDTYHRWMEVMVPVSLIGLPSLSVPIGFGKNGLPMGMQIIGRFGKDRNVLELGQAWHEMTDWPNAQPPKVHE